MSDSDIWEIEFLPNYRLAQCCATCKHSISYGDGFLYKCKKDMLPSNPTVARYVSDYWEEEIDTRAAL